MTSSVTIRSAVKSDDKSIWHMIEPVFRAGETYPLPRDISRTDAFTYWRAPGHEVFVAEDDGQIVGTYYLRSKKRGFTAMQFNFVISSNERAVSLWQSCGFAIIGALPGAFAHPTRGLVDAYVMYRKL